MKSQVVSSNLLKAILKIELKTLWLLLVSQQVVIGLIVRNTDHFHVTIRVILLSSAIIFEF